MRYFLVYILYSMCVPFNVVAQDITINHQGPTEPFPKIYRPGLFFVPKTANATNDLLNNGIHCNAIRTIDIETAINHYTVSSIGDVMAQLEAQKTNILLANSRSDRLVLPITKMPSWLSSSTDATPAAPGWTVSNAVPPANYATWNSLMNSIVDKINNQWGLDPYYEIWNEPDGDYWQGTISEYFELFKNTFFAIKANHPNAKVGGPTVSNFITAFPSTYDFPGGYLTSSQLDNTIIGQVIDSCASWGATLDFISWHKFNVNLHAVNMEIDYLDQKLIGSGNGLVPYIISEWNLPFNYIESELDPAFKINYVNFLKERNIAGQMVAAWQDFEMGTTEFHGDYGLLSWGALHKPSWKALLLLDKMDGELLHVSGSDYRNLATISTFSEDTIRVLVSNYSLPGAAEASLNLFFDNNISSDSLLNNGYTPSKMDSIYRGLITLTGSDPLQQAINATLPVYQLHNNFFQNGRDITLKFPGIIGNHAGLKILIDATHNNVIYQYDSLIDKGYNRNNAVNYLYPNNYFDEEYINIADSAYSFHLDPNGVVLIELYLQENIVSTEELIDEDTQLVVYPNPTNDVVQIGIREQDLKSIAVYDFYGKHIATVNTTSFSMKNYANGMYLLVIQSKQGTVIRKLIKR